MDKQQPQQKLSLGNCLLHNQEIVCICVNTACKKGLLCYQCVFEEHTIHVKDCIPLNMWKLENEEDSKNCLDDMFKTIEESETEIRDLADMVQTHFSKIFERLFMLKEKSTSGLADPSLLFKNFAVWDHYTLKDGYYVVESDSISKMIESLNYTMVDEVKSFVEVQCTKIKLKTKSVLPIKKSPKRFSSTNSNWSHSMSYWDCIGFKVVEDLLIVGVGCYKPDKIDQEYDCTIKIFDRELKDHKVIFEKQFDQSKVEFDSDNLGELMFSRPVPVKKGTNYIIAKFNNKSNSNGIYGKHQTSESTAPFEFVSYKGTSDSYKSGNYSDTTCGDFPYFLYR